HVADQGCQPSERALLDAGAVREGWAHCQSMLWCAHELSVVHRVCRSTAPREPRRARPIHNLRGVTDAVTCACTCHGPRAWRNRSGTAEHLTRLAIAGANLGVRPTVISCTRWDATRCVCWCALSHPSR